MGDLNLNMSKLTKVVLLFFIPVAALASNLITSQHQMFMGGRVVRNYVVNAGCEKNVLNIAVTGNAVTRNTTTPLEGDGDCAINAGATASTYDWAVDTFQKGLDGQGCVGSFVIDGDASLYSAVIRQGGSDYGTALALASYSKPTQINLYFPCGDGSSATVLRIQRASGDPASIKVDSVFVGLDTARGEWVGAAYFGTTSSCTWTRSNSALGAFGTTAACPGPGVDSGANPGPGIIQTSDVDLPQVTVNDLPPGCYTVIATFTGFQSSTSGSPSYAIHDGATYTSVVAGLANNGSQTPVTLVGQYCYAGLGNRTFEIRGAASSGAVNVDNQTGNSRLTFSIYKD